MMELLDADGRLLPNADARVFAYMLFPHAPEDWKNYLLAGRHFTYLADGEHVPARLAWHMFEYGGEPAIWKHVEPAMKDGLTAGHLLLFLWRCAHHAPEHATLTRAQWFATTHMVNAPAGGVSLSTIRAAWGRYKNVSHLWAALHWFDDVPQQDSLGEFLGVANYLAAFALNHRPDANAPLHTLLSDPLMPPAGLAHTVEELMPQELTAAELADLSGYKRAAAR